MSNLLQVRDGAKSYGSKVLFERETFAINEGEHVGVIGPNGAGKTTLFRVLIGDGSQGEELDSGEVIKSRSLRLGYLAQEDQWKPGQSVLDYLAEHTIKPQWELHKLAKGLGLTEELLNRPVTELSGGYRMRVKLLRMIGGEPNLMLLDEPTNYLDLETLLILENFLLSYEGAFLLISHDREFLKRTTDHILEVEGGTITKYPGNIDDYFEQKALIREQLQAQALSQEAKRREILDFAARFGAKATKARQVQSRLKMLDRMETVEVKALPVTARIRIPAPTHTGKQALSASGADLGYGDKVVLKSVNLSFERGDHVGVVGVNGAGKSTLLKALSATMPPIGGKIETGYQVTTAFFAQHVAEQLNPRHTVIESMAEAAHPEITRQDILDLAGSLLFSGDDTRKPVSVLSGGEKSRVALGRVLLKKAPLLILDEPTNHLDFQTVEALTQALADFPGTVITVSHDRGFIRRVASKILEIRDGGVNTYPGTYDEYVWSVQRGFLGESSGQPAAGSGQQPRQRPSGGDQASGRGTGAGTDSAEGKFNFKEKKKELQRSVTFIDRRCRELEKVIENAGKEMERLNQELLEKTGAEAATAAKKLGEAQKRSSDAETEWFELLEKKAALEEEIAAM